MSQSNAAYAAKKFSRRDFLKVGGAGVAGAAMLGVAGCGGGGGSGEGGGSGGGGGSSSEPIKIGGLMGFTGNFAPLSESIRNGMELFFEQQGGKIGERPVKTVYEDTEGDPQKALRKYRQLVSRDQVDVLVGPISSSVALALVEQINRDKKILIDANAAANALSWEKKSDYIYRISFSNWQNGKAGSEYIAENVGKNAYTIAPDYPAGHEAISSFKHSFEEAGGKVVKQAFPQLGSSDFATYLTEIQDTAPDLVYGFLAGSDLIRFVKQYQSFGLKGQVPLTGTAEFGDLLLFDAVGDAATGIVSAVHYSPFTDDEVNQDFVQAYQDKYDGLPNFFSCQGYDSGQVISEAVEQAGSKEPDAMVEALKGISFRSPRGPITIDPKTNNPTQNYYVTRNVKKNDRVELETLDTVEKVAMPPNPPAYAGEG